MLTVSLQETGELLMPQDMKKMQVYGGKQITFEPEEIRKLKTFDEPGLVNLHYSVQAPGTEG